MISGEEESRLAYLDVQAGLGVRDGSLVVFDTGGGSTQFTFGAGPKLDDRFSVDVGAVRYTERFRLGEVVAPDVLVEAKEAISADLFSLDDRGAPDALVAMGRAVTNITLVSHSMATYDPDVVQGPFSIWRRSIGRLGGGAYWRPTDRLVFFAGYFLGLTTPSPDTTLTLGPTFTF